MECASGTTLVTAHSELYMSGDQVLALEISPFAATINIRFSCLDLLEGLSLGSYLSIVSHLVLILVLLDPSRVVERQCAGIRIHVLGR